MLCRWCEITISAEGAAAAPSPAALTCADVETTAAVFSSDNKGVLITVSDTEILWLGCPGDGCSSSQFYCTDLDDGITFGTSVDSAMRACHGVASVDDCVSTGCCTTAGGLCNSPDDQVSADEICRLLGYSTATFVAIDGNGCPETHYDPVEGWTTDAVYSQGYGMSYTCTGAMAASSFTPIVMDDLSSSSPYYSTWYGSYEPQDQGGGCMGYYTD